MESGQFILDNVRFMIYSLLRMTNTEPVVNFPLSTFHCHLSSVNSKLFSLNCHLSSLHSSLSTVLYNLRINGKTKFAIIKPPAIKQIVATSDGHCKLDKPIIA